MTSDPTDQLTLVLDKLEAHPRLAHAYLFEHRHPDPTPDFHYDMIDDWHSEFPRVLTEAFRGAAKSTVAEEAICTLALFRKFHNGLVLGENQPRAVERLAAVKNELENNDRIQAIWGAQVGPIWGESRIELRNGVFIQALGREQSLRGVKHKDRRPDMCFVDDYEDEECVATPEARKKVRRRFYSVLIPALEPNNYKIRVAGTPLDNDALIMHLRKSTMWRGKRYPIEYVDPEGTRTATWPGRFPLQKIDELKRQFTEAGESDTYMREFMCEPEDAAQKPFNRGQFKIQTLTRTWEPVYAIYDPARTTKELTSAQTGIVVFSWIHGKMVVWESRGEFFKPDEIVNDMFKVDERYSPIAIGVEEDGLNEFLLQPIRHEQMRRGQPLPIRALKAPRNKVDFIRGLQPFAKAGEIVLNGEQTQILEQFDAFPRGRVDIINALAYAQKIRIGHPVFPSFGYQHVASDLRAAVRTPAFLAVNAGPGASTAVLMQVVDGRLHVLADWVSDREIGEELRGFVQAAGMELGQKFRVVAPAEHFGTYAQHAVIAAGRKVPVDVHQGGDEHTGREEIRSLLEKNPKGLPGVQVDMRASWTLRAMTGGYAFGVDKKGQVEEDPLDNVYRVLMKGLEAMMALSRMHSEDDRPPRMATTADGRRYISARANMR